MHIEQHIKEEAFGVIDTLFYDFEVCYELCDLKVRGWPEKSIKPKNKDLHSTLSNLLGDAKEIVRDLSRCLEIDFTDAYVTKIYDEGWEKWGDVNKAAPKLGVGRLPDCTYPILRVRNSKWFPAVIPEWNHDWADQLTHWRLISVTNTVDICARAASGKWIEKN